MSNYTYEEKDCQRRRETYEWDHVWWEHGNTDGVPRVLYIGDSISCATRRVATAVAEEKIFFDGFGTSKALDNPYFTESLRLFAAQEGERQVILFNNGLHGWHLEDETAYAEYYEKLIVFLLREFEGVPLILALTTHVARADRDARVVTRNRVVCELAKKYDLPVIDLYTLTKEHEELLSADGVHLLPDGYRLLAQELVKNIKTLIMK